MVPPPPVLSVPPQAFDAYRQRMRAHFGIPTALDTSRCVACHAPSTISEASRREHFKTGLCEARWDLLAIADAPSRLAATQRCSRLAGFSACSYMTTWIAVNRVAPGGRLTCVEPLARHIISVATGREGPPNVWVPGQGPEQGWRCHFSELVFLCRPVSFLTCVRFFVASGNMLVFCMSFLTTTRKRFWFEFRCIRHHPGLFVCLFWLQKKGWGFVF